MIELTDDGTLDTVLRCSECGEEFRYNYDPCGTEERAEELRTEGLSEDSINEALYDEFVEWAIDDAMGDHECPSNEPDEDAITTTDHQTFYQYGKVILQLFGSRWRYLDGPVYRWLPSATDPEDFHRDTDPVTALRIYMNLAQFWPDVWFISDHGNGHRIEL